MPKIVIREIDNTKAGGAPYANFAVVVPGFIADKTADWEPNSEKFDENGIYECASKEDFIKNVGLVGSKEYLISAAVAPSKAKDWSTPKALTQTEFNTLVALGKLYTAESNTLEEIGAFKDSDYIYDLANSSGKDSSGQSYNFKENQETPTEDTHTLFMCLEDIGADAVSEMHYGNQIAFELLSLGYTVLYKQIATDTEGAGSLADEAFWRPLKDKSMYDFRYIISGLLRGNTPVYKNMVDVAEFKPETPAMSPFDEVGITTHGRGDCIALLDIDDDTYLGKSQEDAITATLTFAKDYIPTSKYAAAFAPTVKYAKGGLSQLSAFDNNQDFPASFHYLACAARSSEHFNEWYANAGYTRGISNYTIESVGCKFGEAAVNAFQRRASDPDNNIVMAINPIINLKGSHYMWGNRTTHALEAKDSPNGDLVASHFLNIRQLCSTIKKKVYITCRQLTFDPNSDILWANFCNSIRPLLEKMKADQGIADYKISKVKTNRKAFLAANVRIVPIEAVEDFDISIYLEDSLNGIVATAEE